jgi:hypothetical protein
MKIVIGQSKNHCKLKCHLEFRTVGIYAGYYCKFGGLLLYFHPLPTHLRTTCIIPIHIISNHFFIIAYIDYCIHNIYLVSVDYYYSWLTESESEYFDRRSC